MKVRIVIFLFLWMGCLGVSYCQTDTVSSPQKNREWLRKISVGGIVGAQFGTYTHIECSPHAAYNFNKWVSAGIGLTYMYSNNKEMVLSSHVFGGSAFVSFHFLRYLGAHFEYQLLNYDNYNSSSIRDKERIFSNNFMLGGGYYQRVGNNSAIYFYVLYNFTNRPNDYITLSNPVFKVGFSIGL